MVTAAAFKTAFAAFGAFAGAASAIVAMLSI